MPHFEKANLAVGNVSNAADISARAMISTTLELQSTWWCFDQDDVLENNLDFFYVIDRDNVLTIVSDDLRLKHRFYAVNR